MPSFVGQKNLFPTLLLFTTDTGRLLCNHKHVCSLQKVDTTLLGLSPQDAAKSPYIASMGVYVFKKDILLKLLKWRYPTSNDFGSEIIPSAVTEHNVQVCLLDSCLSTCSIMVFLLKSILTLW